MHLLAVLKYYSNYYSELLQRSGSLSAKVQLLRSIAYEVFRTLNDLNPKFMKEIFNRIYSLPKATKNW